MNIDQKDPANKKTLGLALGGGGAKGLAHIGVLKVLEREGIKIDYIAGTSIGSLVGSYYATYGEVESLERKILEKTDWRTSVSIFDPTFKKGVLKGVKIQSLIQEWIGIEDFKEIKIPCTVVTTDLKSGSSVELNSGDITKSIRASISVPLVFQPVKYGNMHLTDGGLSNPVPDDVAKKMGANKIIAVNLDTGYFDNKDLSKKEMKLKDITLRSLNVLRYHLAKYSLKDAHIIIEPEINEHGLIGWNNFFNRKKAERIIKKGENTAKERISDIKRSFGL